MTLFVVSLFQPFTIHFDVPSSGATARPSPTSQPPPQSSDSSSVPSLFDHKTPANPTPPITPGSKSYGEVFSQQVKPVVDSYFPSNVEITAPARSDPHSPTWGSGRVFNQPQSRAAEAPPPSILKHTRVEERLTNWKSDAKDSLVGVHRPNKPRDRSHDRLFAEASWSVRMAEHGNGGLNNAVRAVSDDGSLLDKTWVGTIGMPTDALTDSKKKDIEDKLAHDHEALTVWCKDSDLDGHYNHYSKQILWPVFHYQIPDNPKSKAYEDHSWIYYVKVNQAFADKIVQNYKRGDVVWVHDYHLMLVPLMVRQKRPDAKIGFFLHVAFPSSEVFRCLAVRKELLEGVLGSNLIGFQISEYCRHFLQTCSRLLCVEATNDSVVLEDRVVNVANFAIGIDPKALSLSRGGATVLEWIQVIKERYQGKKLIVARDKLDHIRGVRQKLLSYELFLNKYPEWKDKTVLIQVATSTTEQAELDATVSDIVTRVNSTHATLAHQPLVFLKQDISFPQYVAMMIVADVLMVTSLREGMNLTSQEFVFFQDGQVSPEKKHGALILSEFTGSSSVFGGWELPVNPWDYRKCAEAIKKALEMDESEREDRWRHLYNTVTEHTAAKWFTNFTDHLDKVYDEQHARDSISTPRLQLHALGEKYKQAEQRLFLLDYEGTLASWGAPSSIILTSPQRVLDVLNDLILDPRNVVWIMSGRKPEELDRLFRRVPGLGLIAENGCFLREANSESWAEMADNQKMNAFKKSVTGILDYYKERNEGSWVEERYCSLVFHFAKGKGGESTQNQAGECSNHLNEACESQRVRAIPIDGDVLVEPLDWNKGTAAAWVLDKLQKKNSAASRAGLPDFLMVAGNSRDDETIFRWANKLYADKAIKHVTTVSVGSRNTEAMATLTQGITGALSALQKLAALSNKA